jgi:hypothetical protein
MAEGCGGGEGVGAAAGDPEDEEAVDAEGVHDGGGEGREVEERAVGDA